MLKCISSLLETQPKEVVAHSEAVSNLLDLMDSLVDLPRETTQQIRKLESGLMKRVMNQVSHEPGILEELLFIHRLDVCLMLKYYILCLFSDDKGGGYQSSFTS